MPGPPPRQHKHERRDIIHAHNHSNKAKMKEWLWPPNDIRGPCGPKASWHLSYRWEKTPKKHTQETCPVRDSNPARCVTGAHSTACSTAVDQRVCKLLKIKTFNNYLYFICIFLLWSNFKHLFFIIKQCAKFVSYGAFKWTQAGAAPSSGAWIWFVWLYWQNGRSDLNFLKFFYNREEPRKILN